MCSAARLVIFLTFVIFTAEPTLGTYEDMMFVFDGSGYATLSSQITIPTFDAFSVCFWMQTTGSNLGSPFSYYDSVNDELAVYVFNHGGALGIYSCSSLITGVTGNDGNWNHVCLTWEDSGQVYFYWNGVQTAEQSGCMANANITGGGCFRIGQWQTSCSTSSFQALGSYSGNIAYFNIYSSALNETEVASLASNCTDNGDGDVLAWSDIMNSTLTSVTVETADVCPCNETTAPVNGSVAVTGTGISRGDEASFSCDAGYYLVGANNASCTNNGWSYDIPECSDIDECSSNNGNCGQTCVNEDGSYHCTCSNGYELNNDGLACDDIDECSVDNGGCNQTCVNIDGSFSCNCTAGYELDNDNTSCNDIDECSDNNGGCNQTCVNIGGSYSCDCTAGYELDNDGSTCNDIDECSLSSGGCDQICINSVGSFSCNCTTGYELDNDGITCNEILGIDLTITDANVTSPVNLVYQAELDSFITFYIVIENVGDTDLVDSSNGDSRYNISFYFSQQDDLDATVNQTAQAFTVDLNSATNLDTGVAASSTLTITDVQALVNVPSEDCPQYRYACFLVLLSSTVSDTESDTTNNDFCVAFSDEYAGQLTCSASNPRMDWLLTAMTSLILVYTNKMYLLH
ncbi:uncharacterized protein [Ptychodera flava]|uniref:uncharacterized protein n=1 Tax=Ptychodera flava TaxID=63121 RepID=UPI003969CCE5